MAGGLDIETVLNSVETFLKANLNAEITAMNTKKADAITLASVDSDAYFLQSLNNRIANFNPFVFYGVEALKAEAGIGPATKTVYSLNVVIVLADAGEDIDVDRRMFRYGKVLSDLFHKNWSRITRSDTVEIESREPVRFKLLNSSDDFRAVGVILRGDNVT
jgi:hypothetical protein